MDYMVDVVTCSLVVLVLALGPPLLLGSPAEATAIGIVSLDLALRAQPVRSGETGAAPAGSAPRWYEDSDNLSAVTSMVAVLISVLAIWLSHKGTSAQQIREKREELRGVLARLVELREQHSISFKTKDEAEKATIGGFRNIMRSVYLEAAESLARQIPRHVSAAEYQILGAENFYDSDLMQARRYYKLGTQRSRDSSPTKQSELWRALASTYVLDDSTMRDADQARDCYSQAVKVLGGLTAPYAVYTRTYSYREWAYGEISLKNYLEAERLLINAEEEWNKIPEWAGFDVGYELRTMANLWRSLGEQSFAADLAPGGLGVEIGRRAFGKAFDMLKFITEKYGIENDYSLDAKALVFQEWGRNEIVSGSKQEGSAHLAQAQDLYASISDEYPWRVMRLKAVAELMQLAVQDKAQAVLASEAAVTPRPPGESAGPGGLPEGAQRRVPPTSPQIRPPGSATSRAEPPVAD